jgi:hypothetical protein
VLLNCCIHITSQFCNLQCIHQSLLPVCSLEKRVNKKVMAMFEKAEDEYNDLMSKKNIIEVSPIMYSFLDKLKVVLISGHIPCLICRMTRQKSRK